MENNASVKEAECIEVIYTIYLYKIIKNSLAARVKSKSLLIYESCPFCNQAVVKIRRGQGLHLWQSSIALMLLASIVTIVATTVAPVNLVINIYKL